MAANRHTARIILATSITLAAFGASAQEFVLEEDIVYGKGGDAELKLDLARPNGDGPFPAIVFIHGGGWYLGDKNAYRSLIEAAARRGYVAASISYRLMAFDQANKETATAEPIFPAQLHDAKAAIRWLRASADKYQIDADRIGVTGRSAGGYLSLMLGLTDDQSGLEGNGGNPGVSSRVQAVVNVYGPTDMAAIHETSSVPWIFRLFLGGAPAETADTYRQASPVTYVSRNDPPVLTLQGDRDRAVPLTQAETLDQRMKSVGASHTLLVFAGQGHGFGGEHRQKELNAMWAFFDENLSR